MKNFIKQGTIYLATAVEAGAALLIGIAAVQALIKGFSLFLVRTEPPNSKEIIRLQLGRWLSVALEFELAADILRTGITKLVGAWTVSGYCNFANSLKFLFTQFLFTHGNRASRCP